MGFAIVFSTGESGQIDGGMVAIKVMRANDMMKKAPGGHRAGTAGTTTQALSCSDGVEKPLQCGGYNMDMVVELWIIMVIVRIQPTI